MQQSEDDKEKKKDDRGKDKTAGNGKENDPTEDKTEQEEDKIEDKIPEAGKEKVEKISKKEEDGEIRDKDKKESEIKGKENANESISARNEIKLSKQVNQTHFTEQVDTNMSIINLMTGLGLFVGVERTIIPHGTIYDVVVGKTPGVILRREISAPFEFDTFEIPENGGCFILAKNFNLKFSTYDESILELLKLIDQIIEHNLFYLVEPPSESYQDVQTKSPLHCGVDEGKFAHRLEYEEVRNTFAECCKPKKFKEYNFVGVKTLCLHLSSIIRKRMADLLRSCAAGEQNDSRDKLLDFIRIVSHADFESIRHIAFITNTKVTFPVQYSWKLMDALNGLIKEEFFRMMLSLQCIRPMINLTSVDLAGYLNTVQLSSARGSILYPLINMKYQDYMNDEIALIIQSYLFLGYFRLDVIFPDPTPENALKNMVIAFVVKMLCNYTEVNDECNISEDSARETDQYIRDGLIGHGVNFYEDTSIWPLNFEMREGTEDVGRRRNFSTITKADLDGIKTRNNGIGWMSDGKQMRVNNDWGHDFYPEIETRPLLGPISRDDTPESFKTNARLYESQWKLLESIKTLVTKLTKVGSNKGDLRELMIIFGSRAVSVLGILTRYMRLNYYSGWRFTRTRLGSYFADNSGNIPEEVTVHAETFIYMLLAMDVSKELTRSLSVKSQLESEVRFEEELADAMALDRITRSWVTYLNLTHEYTNYKYMTRVFTHKTISPLKNIYMDLHEARIHNAIDPKFLSRSNFSTIISDLKRDVFTDILNSISRIGLVDSFILSMTEPFPTLPEIMNYAGNGKFWTNVQPARYLDIAESYEIKNIAELLRKRRYNSSVKRMVTESKNVEFRMVLPYELNISTTFDTQSNPVKAIWDYRSEVPFYGRDNIIVTSIKDVQTYVVKRNQMFHDDYVGQFTIGENVYVKECSETFWALDKWNPSQYFVETPCVKTTTTVQSFFDAIK